MLGRGLKINITCQPRKALCVTDKIQPVFLLKKHKTRHTVGNAQVTAARNLIPQHSGAETPLHTLSQDRGPDGTVCPTGLPNSTWWLVGCLCQRNTSLPRKSKTSPISVNNRSSELGARPQSQLPGDLSVLDVDVSKTCLPFPACKPSRILFSF